MKVLLVEDNPADAGLVEEAFREGPSQHTLDVVSDGDAALAYLGRKGAFANAPEPDLILLDLNLSKKDGREVLAEVKADPVLRQIPIIVLTTSDDESDVHRAYGLHANCYLTKPVEFDDFMKRVRLIEEFWLTFVRLPGKSGPSARRSVPLRM